MLQFDTCIDFWQQDNVPKYRSDIDFTFDYLKCLVLDDYFERVDLDES